MGVYIKLNPEQGPVTVRDRYRARIAFGGQVWAAFEGYFYPSSAEIWKYATLKELDGTRLKSLPLEPASRSADIMTAIDGLAKNMTLEDLLYSIVLVKGIWHINQRSIVGHISINNAPEWRKMYSDIEVDGETHVQGEDFSDVVLNAPDMGEPWVNGFIKKLSEYRDTPARLSAIYFFDGPVTKAEIFNAKAVFYQSTHDYVTDLLTSYRTELTDNKESNLLSGLSPYKQSFLVSALVKNDRFQKQFAVDLKQSQITPIQEHSVLFLGQNKDSFRKAYELLKKSVFEKMAKGLPKAERLEMDVDNAMGAGQRNIDDSDDPRVNAP